MPATAKTDERRFTPATIALIAAGLLAAIAIGIAAFRPGDTSGASAATATNTNAQYGGTVEHMVASLQGRLLEDPDNHELWYMLGLAQRDRGDFTQAAQAFRRAMELSPQNADYPAYLAEMILIQAGQAGQSGQQR